MTAGRRILFLPDFGPGVGGGHAMRCLTLAGALVERGADCVLAVENPAGLDSYAGPVELIALHEGRPAAARAWGADLIVVDHYGLAAPDEQAIGGRLAVIDDLADRPHVCELLIDPGYGRAAADYERLTPAGTTILAGPAYALIRPEFARARPAALERRSHSTPQTALISLGLTDVGGITGRVLEALLPHAGPVRLEAVLASGAPSLSYAETFQDRIGLHVDVRHMAELLARADVGVGAGGSSVWERACLGLPSLCLVLADNQAAMAQALDQAGIVLAVDARARDFETALGHAFERLVHDEAMRSGLSQRSATVCDGLGAARVAEALLAKLG